ncbi:MAG: MotA/TolQ/ExbB proton channel family protein [Kiritimatiellia bacterium]
MFALPLSFPLATASFIKAFNQSDISGKFIVVLLLVASAYCWMLIIMNWIALNRAARESGRFKYHFSRETHPMNLYLQRKKFQYTPLFAIYETACRGVVEELSPAVENPNDLFVKGGLLQEAKLSPLKVDSIRDKIERRMADEAVKLEGELSYLGAAVNAAPFLGMFGTVLGVMSTFAAIGETGSVVISEVAPGISAALITTVMGLVVALPASIAYSVLGRKLRTLAVDMDNFTQEMNSLIRRHYLREY